MMHRLRAGVLGAGRIASGFDAPRDRQVQTLAHALKLCPRFKLAGFFDRDPRCSIAAEKKWSCAPSPRNRKTWLDAGWDVVLIATPDDAHAEDLSEVLKRRPRGVLVEKPLAPDGNAALRLLRLAQRLGVPLLVDFPRREHLALRQIGQRLRAGTWGAIRRISGVYSAGVRHNGVHLLDLIAAWLPPVSAVRKLAASAHEGLFEVRTARTRVPLILADAAQTGCYVFELCVETERGRIELSGIPEMLHLSLPAPHPNFAGFTALKAARQWPMENEPLLLRSVERLARIAASPTRARAQIRLEIQRQIFFNKVFDLYP